VPVVFQSSETRVCSPKVVREPKSKYQRRDGSYDGYSLMMGPSRSDGRKDVEDRNRGFSSVLRWCRSRRYVGPASHLPPPPAILQNDGWGTTFCRCLLLLYNNIESTIVILVGGYI
jgi:hypothetical protein